MKRNLSQSLALELSYNILDSGNLYRLVGLISKRISSENSIKIQKELESKTVTMKLNDPEKLVEVFFGMENVTEELRTEEVAMLASSLAKHISIREILKKYQRDYFDSEVGLVADGKGHGYDDLSSGKVEIFSDCFARGARQKTIRTVERNWIGS